MSGEQVRVTMPCVPRFARVARAAAAACGVLAGFTVEELDDLRLLVDEVFVAMLELGVTAIELVVTPQGGRVDVLMAASAGPARPAAAPTPRSPDAGRMASDVGYQLAGPRPSFASTLSQPAEVTRGRRRAGRDGRARVAGARRRRAAGG